MLMNILPGRELIILDGQDRKFCDRALEPSLCCFNPCNSRDTIFARKYAVDTSDRPTEWGCVVNMKQDKLTDDDWNFFLVIFGANLQLMQIILRPALPKMLLYLCDSIPSFKSVNRNVLKISIGFCC